MAEDKDKILETPEVPEVEAVEAIVDEGVDTAPEVTEEEILVVSETDKPSPADEPFLADNRVKSGITPKWNWGAMAMPVFFGVANRSYLGLLSLLVVIPWLGWIFGIVWAIVFGLNGERWALQNPDNRYRDEEEFRKVMDGWNRAGLVAFIIGAVVTVLLLLFFMIIGAAIFSNMDQLQY
ncbi:hypothetical protein ACYYIR_09510 [Lactococcus garvieae]|uniref:Uncharacterized protein n=1 Tax=Lactococcus garvieae (strain Lg2) TaxID=420890 RepID=F9VGC6_LACGL|nr:hypothetical protein [Lactococcus garvieae]EOT30900.1 hypothetical protein OO3_01899 [Lactococcus garvieae ATCC 49156]EOT94630.1 hypothetical protein I578_00319 [Lactococcus garvieae ATCC 49156]BAK59409.1 conserved hypothetical protein [Lactococcus garvieae ATCC 49156]BAK61377.1 conserved hypothetical protein [Lactococcus garvieae Lg2]BDW48287.1 hypothetical protein LG21E12_18680 [Lactococcus garvieae]